VDGLDVTAGHPETEGAATGGDGQPRRGVADSTDDRTRSAIDAAWDAARALCAPDVPQAAEPIR
jgi:hypothetical protein